MTVEEEKPETVAQDVEVEDGEIVETESQAVPTQDTPKLPLEHAWTLWFDNPRARNRGSWGASLDEIFTFDTVEDFWW